MKITDLQEYKVLGGQPTKQEEPKDTGVSGIKGFGVGVGKGLTSTTLGLGRLAGKASSGIGKVIPGNDPFEKYGKAVESGYGNLSPATDARGMAEKAGKFTEQVGEFFIPGGAGLKASKGAKLATKVGMGALETGAVSTAQTGSFTEGAKGAAIGGGLPIAGKALSPVVNLTKRLFKGVGSGLSGMSSGQLNAILADPRKSRMFVRQINQAGGPQLLRSEAEKIVQGVSRIRQEARGVFGKGLESLESVPKGTLSGSLKAPMEKYGITTKNGVLDLKNIEFDSAKNLTKAKDLLTKINSQEDLSGKAVRKLVKDIESSAYKTTGTDAERLAFNAFIKDLGTSVEEAITKTSPKLQSMKQAFSQEMQLAEGVEKIFGKVKFKNTKEILTTANKLESLFNQKGLAPETVEKFLTRIGENPTSFKAGEAVRQVGELSEKSNSIGTNPFEIIRSITSAIVPPKAVRTIAIQTGIAEGVIKEVVAKLSPAARGALFRAILGNNSQDINNQ